MRLRRFLAVFVGLVVVLVLAFWALTASLNMSNPLVLGRYVFTPTSEVGNLFASRPLTASTNPRPVPVASTALPETVRWRGDSVPTEQFLADTETNAFIVACRGEIVSQWYRTDADENRTHSSWSVAKSVVSLVIGQQIAEGLLSDDTRLVEVLPEFANGTDFDQITVGHLLDMSSGIDVNEDYSYFKPFWGVGGLQITTDLPGYLLKNRGLRFEPGSKSDYRSVDVQYLSMIASKVENKPLTEIVQSRLWQPLGMENDATWNLDQPGGIEKGFSALNATARDFLKFGLLVQDNGLVGDEQVQPSDWIGRISTPSVEASPDWMYSSLWWHPPGHELWSDITALGVYGQYVYVADEFDTVITKLSDYGSEQDERETVYVFRQLAKSCSEQGTNPRQ